MTHSHWFALYVKSCHENATSRLLRALGFVEFVPTFAVRSTWSDRVKKSERPLFPGYVFCRFSRTQRGIILSLPTVVRIVGNGPEPCPIDEREIQALQLVFQAQQSFTPVPYLRIGQKVRIERGPLRGLEGLLEQDKNRHWIVLSVTVLERSVAVEVSRDCISVPASPDFHSGMAIKTAPAGG